MADIGLAYPGWLQQLEAFFDPNKLSRPLAGIIMLRGAVNDRFYYDHRAANVSLVDCLIEHYRNSVHTLAWYDVEHGLNYAKGTPHSELSSQGSTPDTSANTIYDLNTYTRRDRTSGFQNGRYANDPYGALQHADERVFRISSEPALFVFGDFDQWELLQSGQEAVVTRVQRWSTELPERGHIAVFAGRRFSQQTALFLRGLGVQEIEVDKPTVETVRRLLLLETYRALQRDESPPLEDAQLLDDVADVFTRMAAGQAMGYKDVFNAIRHNRRGKVYDQKWVEQHRSGFDPSQIDLDELRTYLDQNFIGQTQAKDVFLRRLRRLKAFNINKNERKPAIRFMLAGPSGVGKTELCRLVSRFVFKKDAKIVPCNHFKEKHKAEAELFGAPPGYVGYGQPGLLEKYLSEVPPDLGVIVFDEIDKAHPEVQDLIMTILDQGFATTGDGKQLEFVNTFLCATTNTGSNIDSGISGSLSPEERNMFYDKAIREQYRPEVLGRFQEIVIYDQFTHAQRIALVELYMRLSVEAKRAEENLTQFALDPTPEFLERFISDIPISAGARQIKEQADKVVDEAALMFIEVGYTLPGVLDWSNDGYNVANIPLVF